MRDLAARIDHTLLTPTATRADVERLCDEAREHGFATVCVNGARVSLAARRLDGSPVGVSCVVAFPLGASHAEVKAAEARRALADGATELDCVLALGALRDGDDELVVRDLGGVVAAARASGALVKAILETGLLDEGEVARAALLAVRAGADFVKTSTGFGGRGATVRDVELLRRAVGTRARVKASGGIRTREAALALLAAGADRIGASASLALIGAGRDRGPRGSSG